MSTFPFISLISFVWDQTGFTFIEKDRPRTVANTTTNTGALKRDM